MIIRKVILLILLVLTFITIDKLYSKNPKIDTCLVGTWSGSEKGQQWKDVQKNWIQYQYPDGKFVTPGFIFCYQRRILKTAFPPIISCKNLVK